MVLKEVFEKNEFEKKSADDNKSMENYQKCKQLKAEKKKSLGLK